MATFPLRARPSQSYKVRPRAFGSPRDGGKRKHAGCDLYAPAGSEVLAVEDGVVTHALYPFYDIVFAIEITHASGVVRYGEISKAAEGLQVGTKVVEGQVVGIVGAMKGVAQSMLHFEQYSGTGHGPLTDRTSKGFERRADLLDPTVFLDACMVAKG